MIIFILQIALEKSENLNCYFPIFENVFDYHFVWLLFKHKVLPIFDNKTKDKSHIQYPINTIKMYFKFSTYFEGVPQFNVRSDPVTLHPPSLLSSPARKA